MSASRKRKDDDDDDDDKKKAKSFEHNFLPVEMGWSCSTNWGK
jgi:hypothetical protein